jgi:hypothetical protein
MPFEENEDIINNWLEYMKNQFNYDRSIHLAYFANRLKNPANRIKVCIVIYGEEGDGKNRLCDIIKNIFGESCYTELASAKQMLGSHSCIEKEKLFACVNEADDNYENADVLKAYHSRNSEFFNKFSIDIVENPKALRVIYEHLMKFDVKSILPSGNFQNHIPETDIQKVVIQSNKDKILIFLEYLASNCLIDEDEKAVDISNEIKYSNNLKFEKWIRWIETNRYDLKYKKIAFHTRFALLIKRKLM